MSRCSKPVAHPPSFAETVALIAITEAMRLTSRNAGRCRLAVVVAPQGGPLVIYNGALERYYSDFFGKVLKDKRSYGVDAEPKNLAATLLSFPQVQHLAILIADLEQVTPEVRLVADRIIEVRAPIPEDFLRAAEVAGSSLSQDDAVFLARQDLQAVRQAFVRGRCIADAVKRLRGFARYAELQRERVASIDPDRKKNRLLGELPGYGVAKEWGLGLVSDLRDWRAGSLAWDEVDRGALLVGPPGVGKTVFATALANSCGVPLFAASLAKWQASGGGHLGDLLKAMRKSFEDARKSAPAILFLDELDSVGDRDKVSGDNAQYSREVINALLEQVDGTDGRDGVVIVGATNRIEDVDPAIYRSGRLETVVEIGLPNAADREAILRLNLPGLPSGLSSRFNDATGGWSGADVERLARAVRRECRNSGAELSFSLVEQFLPKPVPLAKDVFWRVCVHEAGHALAAHFIAGRRVKSLTVRPHHPVSGNQLGDVIVDGGDGEARTRSWYENMIAVTLGGLAAEQSLLGEFADSGGGDESSDLNKANYLATCIVAGHAMDKGWVVESDPTPERMRQRRWADRHLCKKVDGIIDRQFLRALSLMADQRALLRRLATAASEFLEMDEKQIEALIGVDVHRGD